MKNNWRPISFDVDNSLRDKYPEILLRILANRGISNELEIEKFLNPDYSRGLYDHLLLKNIKKSVKRFLAGLDNKEKILIFADYDADGVPGAAIISSFLDKIGYSNYEVYIPDRYSESYGLNEEQMANFLKQDFKLLITVDCGIKSNQAVSLARKNDLDVIITDHHLAGEELPPTEYIIDPWQKGDKYPFKELAGAGVAFKFVQAVLAHRDFGLVEGWEKWLLDLVAIATIGDMVPLKDENRILTYFGLTVLAKTKRPGLKAMFKSLRLNINFLQAEDVSFSIAPRLNAASRLSHGLLAYRLLTTSSVSEAGQISSQLEKLNKDRRGFVDEMLAFADNFFSTDELPDVLVIGHKDWNPGVLGLAASKLVEKYNRPVFIWAENGAGEIKGSCRGTGEEDVVALMEEAGGLNFFSDLGGHYSAGGFSLPVGKLKDLNKQLNDSVCQKDFYLPEITYDEELNLEDISESFYKQVDRCAPFGQANPRPVFLFRNLTIVDSRFFGSGQEHLEIVLKDKDKQIKAIKFFVGNKLSFKIGQKVNILANLEKNFFRSSGELRLRLLDICPLLD
ncbi:MAG TPA: single-stranded-DNA-specific exonuclease RecJ [Candidatus Vogelbacteria bacterium]|nr:single-stranded-DNA-specific exonuclease RecJ [Candidatus Vogelbacteria bacterium]